MTATDDILAQIPISSLAAQLGVDFGDQRDAVVSRLSGAGPGGVSGGLVAKLPRS